MILKNVRAVLPQEEEICDVRISDGRIVEIGNSIKPQDAEEVRECNGAILMPGFIDTHIHGGLSKAFFSEDMNYHETVKNYAKRGTTALAPTFSCMPIEQFVSGVGRTTKFARDNKYGAKIVGIHAEGPFLNHVRRGGMKKEFMVEPSVEHFNKLYDACDGMLKIITIAPEVENATEVIKEAVKRGVAVSAGHTDATYDEMKRAIDAGVSRMTHTFNAARPINHREPGVLGAALNDPRVNCEVICDFGHLNPATVEMIWKLKGSSGFTVVSDYSDKFGKAALGEGPHEVDGVKYTIWHGVAWSEAGGVMANSNDMLVSVKNLYSIGIPLTDIAIMASANPAKAVGAFDDTGSIEVGKAADLVLLDDELCVIDAYVDGCCIE